MSLLLERSTYTPGTLTVTHSPDATAIVSRTFRIPIKPEEPEILAAKFNIPPAMIGQMNIQYGDGRVTGMSLDGLSNRELNIALKRNMLMEPNEGLRRRGVRLLQEGITTVTYGIQRREI